MSGWFGRLKIGLQRRLQIFTDWLDNLVPPRQPEPVPSHQQCGEQVEQSLADSQENGYEKVGAVTPQREDPTNQIAPKEVGDLANTEHCGLVTSLSTDVIATASGATELIGSIPGLDELPPPPQIPAVLTDWDAADDWAMIKDADTPPTTSDTGTVSGDGRVLASDAASTYEAVASQVLLELESVAATALPPRLNPKSGRQARERALLLLSEGAAAFNSWRESKSHQSLLLARVDFRSADLRGVEWRGCVLAGSMFDEADLRGASFRGAIIRDCRFHEACVEGVDFGEHDMRELNGLDLTGPRPPVLAENRWWRVEPDLKVKRAARTRWDKHGNVRTKVRVTNASHFVLPISIWLCSGEERVMAGTAEIPPGERLEIPLMAEGLPRTDELVVEVDVVGNIPSTPSYRTVL